MLAVILTVVCGNTEFGLEEMLLIEGGFANLWDLPWASDSGASTGRANL